MTDDWRPDLADNWYNDDAWEWRNDAQPAQNCPTVQDPNFALDITGTPWIWCSSGHHLWPSENQGGSGFLLMDRAMQSAGQSACTETLKGGACLPRPVSAELATSL